MLFKIPRNIERRKATPDMDLYDQVVGLDCEAVHIWTRQEKAVEPIVILFREITGVRLYQRLLLGICTIYGQNGGTEIRYNTVSSAIMWKFTELIRKECPIENVAPTGIQGDLNLRENDVDIWLYNQMRDLWTDGGSPSVGHGLENRDTVRQYRRGPLFAGAGGILYIPELNICI